jgi:N-acetylglucosaminyl-diphospho-decaprenol L-rhamnosyltransferase
LDLSIIVVSYNTREITLECLRSVFAETHGLEFELLVVDNDSSDGSAEAIRSEFPDVWLDALDTNLGFAGANNHAARRANGNYILLLNPDTLVLDGAIQSLFRFAESYRGRGIFGGRTLFPDRSLNPSSCWSRITLWSMFCSTTGLTAVFRGSKTFNPEAFGSWQRDSVREVDIIAGCFLLLERRLWEELEGFDSRFLMYGEDADLCLRAGHLGARCVMTPDATIVHYGGASEPVRSDKLVRLYTARTQLMQRYMGPAGFRLGVGMRVFGTGLRYLVSRILSAGRGEQRSENAAAWADVWQRRRDWSQP